MFERLRSRVAHLRQCFIDDPNLLIVPLGTSLDELRCLCPEFTRVQGEGLWLDAVDFSERPSGILCSVRSDKVMAVNYDTDVYRETSHKRLRKMLFLLEQYGRTSPFELFMDNGWAYMYKSADGLCKAVYSYVNDTFNVSFAELKLRTSCQPRRA